MVDCRYKRNNKKKVCKDKKKKVKKTKKTKKTQSQSQKQTVNIHIHHKKTKTKTKTKTRKKHPYIPRVNAAASHVPLRTNNAPATSHSDYLISRLRGELSQQRDALNEMKEYNKIKYDETTALKKNLALMEEDNLKKMKDISILIPKALEEASRAGIEAGLKEKKNPWRN